MVKILVTYYSRSGNNKLIAQEIKGILKADIDLIVPEKSYDGFFGFLRAGSNALKKKIIKINTKKEPSKYDLVIIGGPLWAGSLSAPVRSYLAKNEIKKLAFFSCCGSGEPKKSIEQLNELRVKPSPMLFLSEKKVKANMHHSEVISFCNKIKQRK